MSVRPPNISSSVSSRFKDLDKCITTNLHTTSPSGENYDTVITLRRLQNRKNTSCHCDIVILDRLTIQTDFHNNGLWLCR